MGISRSNETQKWILKAKEFYAKENWVGALSSIRNALRLDVKNLAAWHLGTEILMRENRVFESARYAKVLLRFAKQTKNEIEARYAEQHLKETEQYFATQHLRLGETDLTHFAAQGNIEKVTELLASGVNVNERNQGNWTALHRVAMNGTPEMARLLVEKGANLEEEDELKETPLITACRFSNVPVALTCIELGSNVNHKAKEKHTALWYAISSTKDLQLVKLLISSGAKANEKYAYGDTPFLLAIQAQSNPIAEYLLPLTKDVGHISKQGISALHFCASYDNVSMIRKILARGVNINSTITGGVTALMNACQHYRVKAARVLLEHGALTQIINEYGETARSIAEHHSHEKILELLDLAEAK